MFERSDADTFVLELVGGIVAIRCQLCNRVSELAHDVEQRYCSRCHLFHASVREGRRLVALGMTHECHEWRTYRQVCALCGVGLTANDGGRL